ncbi:hypothetical protein [uncultured Pontibacter sp.]|uniref:hypothetical protein n=1 Tax=uncultured Pontibacter sp. TaxID=453356 RepID=UPI00263924F4|nr:hypothetical protein [uncultured Pontibacter sp.]
MKDQNKDKKSELTDTNKSNPKDTSNSLSRDKTDTKLNQKQTPQARTDNEQDREQQKHNL